MSLMDSLVRPTILYVSKVWGPCLLKANWASAERVQILLLRRIIRCKHIVPQYIILTEFGARPFRLKCFPPYFTDSMKGRDWYPYLAYHSSEYIALSIPPSHTKCWFAWVSDLLESVGRWIGLLHSDTPWMRLATSYLLDKN